MPRQNATIYDVAREAGVSPSTVSRVLNEPSLVQSDTRKKVVDAIGALSFVPKADAVAHARRQYKKIGVIAPFFTEPSFMQRLRGLSSVFSGKHYELVIYAIESAEELSQYVDMIALNRRLDGLVSLCLTMGDASLETLRASGLPVCFVEADVPGFDSVLVDNYEGGRMAAGLLYERGYRKPSFVGEVSRRPFAIPATDLRLRGFRDYLSERGIEIGDSRAWVGEFSSGSADRSFARVLEGDEPPDCVFASSDAIALRLLRIASERGIRVPDDMGLVGFDGLDVAEYVRLATVNQGLDESGRLAAEMILDRLRDPARAPRKVIASLDLNARETVRAAAFE